MRKFFHLLSGVVTVLVAAPASAQESISDSGLYIGIAGVGADGSFASTEWTDSAFGVGERTWVVDYHFGALAALGYQWAGENSPTDFRLEIEGGYRRSNLEGLIDQDGVLTAVDGYLETGSLMANGYVDFHLGERASPYLGAGIGAARLARRDINVAGILVTNKFTYTTAWQLMAGIGYRLSPGTVLGLEVRYVDLQSFNFPQGAFFQDVLFNEILITFRLVG